MALIIFFSFPQMPNALDAYMMHGRHSKRHTEVGKRIQLSLTQGKCPFQGISTILVPRLCTKSPKHTVANSLGCVEMFYIWGVSWLETRQLSVKNMQTSWRSQFQQYTILHSLHKLWSLWNLPFQCWLWYEAKSVWTGRVIPRFEKLYNAQET